jgi:hypothetical protein
MASSGVVNLDNNNKAFDTIEETIRFVNEIEKKYNDNGYTIQYYSNDDEVPFRFRGANVFETSSNVCLLTLEGKYDLDDPLYDTERTILLKHSAVVLLNRFAIAKLLEKYSNYNRMPWETKEEARPRLERMKQLRQDKELLVVFCNFVKRDQLRSFRGDYNDDASIVLCHTDTIDDKFAIASDDKIHGFYTFHTFDKEAFLSRVKDGIHVIQRLYDSENTTNFTFQDFEEGKKDKTPLLPRPKWSEDIESKWTRCGIMTSKLGHTTFGLFDSKNNMLAFVTVSMK